MVASTENSMGAFEKSHHHDQRDTSELGEDTDATKRSAPHANELWAKVGDGVKG
jgi:hypothetical protein